VQGALLLFLPGGLGRSGGAKGSAKGRATEQEHVENFRPTERVTQRKPRKCGGILIIRFKPFGGEDGRGCTPLSLNTLVAARTSTQWENTPHGGLGRCAPDRGHPTNRKARSRSRELDHQPTSPCPCPCKGDDQNSTCVALASATHLCKWLLSRRLSSLCHSCVRNRMRR